MLAIEIRWTWLDIIEKVRVIAALFQLHQYVLQLNFVSDQFTSVARDNRLVQLLLKFGETNRQVYLFFVWNVMLDVEAQSSQHKWSQ